MAKKFYVCTECKKQIDSVNDVLFIEETSNKGFCSEICILNFYRPYMDIFEKQELEFRLMLSMDSEDDIKFSTKQEEVFNQVLYEPDEVWLDLSELKEEYYTHIYTYEESSKQPIYLVFVCSYFDSGPSFIFHKCITRSKKLVDYYRVGNKIELDGPVEDEFDLNAPSDYDEQIELPVEVLEEIEQKKSQMLAELLAIRNEIDIKFEDFLSYEKYLASTLEDPDEIYEVEDDDGEELSSYIKSFKEGHDSFFYIVICMRCQYEGLDGDVLVPVLAFPSIDQDLYKEYAIGRKVKGQVKN